jgi:hypothetical protein
MRLIEMKGKKFGHLTVIDRADNHITKSGREVVMYKCLCDCGNIKNIQGNYLRSGHTKSCGCQNRKVFYENQSRLREIWSGMNDRCFNPKCTRYKYYGGRGITVCEEWRGKKGAENFRDWAMANGYSDDLTIDRIDVNGNYEPSNCRWATLKEQMNNRRSSVYITYKNETHTISEWADITKIPDYKLRYRYRRGYSAERILGK